MGDHEGINVNTNRIVAGAITFIRTLALRARPAGPNGTAAMAETATIMNGASMPPR